MKNCWHQRSSVTAPWNRCLQPGVLCPTSAPSDGVTSDPKFPRLANGCEGTVSCFVEGPWMLQSKWRGAPSLLGLGWSRLVPVSALLSPVGGRGSEGQRCPDFQGNRCPPFLYTSTPSSPSTHSCLGMFHKRAVHLKPPRLASLTHLHAGSVTRCRAFVPRRCRVRV